MDKLLYEIETLLNREILSEIYNISLTIQSNFCFTQNIDYSLVKIIDIKNLKL